MLQTLQQLPWQADGAAPPRKSQREKVGNKPSFRSKRRGAEPSGPFPTKHTYFLTRGFCSVSETKMAAVEEVIPAVTAAFFKCTVFALFFHRQGQSRGKRPPKLPFYFGRNQRGL